MGDNANAEFGLWMSFTKVILALLHFAGLSSCKKIFLGFVGPLMTDRFSLTLVP